MPLTEQVGQLSQPKRAAACVSFGKCEKRASNIALYYGIDVDK